MTSIIIEDVITLLAYVTPLFLVLAGIAFADTCINFLLKLLKKGRDSVKW